MARCAIRLSKTIGARHAPVSEMNPPPS
jgi:hypothetical protein